MIDKIDLTVPLRLELTLDGARQVAQRITEVEMIGTRTQPNMEHSPSGELNAVEQLERVADMLNRSHGDLSFGLRSPEDAIRLWRAFVAAPTDEYPDVWTEEQRVAVLGYDPMIVIPPVRKHALKPESSKTKAKKPRVTGASVRNARKG